MPKFKVTVEQYERHVATYEEEIEADNQEEAIAAAIARVIGGEAEEPMLAYCDLSEDSGALEIPDVSEHRMYTALTLAGISVDDADGPRVASVRTAYAKVVS